MPREKRKEIDGLTKTILSTAKSLHKHGFVDKTAYEKITLRHPGDAVQVTAKALTGREIRTLRDKEPSCAGAPSSRHRRLRLAAQT